MNCFKYVFSTFMDLERCSNIAGNGGLYKPSDFINNILICVPKMNEGVKRHDGWVINDIIFIFGWTNPLSLIRKAV